MQLPVQVAEDPSRDFASYASIPIAFVTSLQREVLSERRLTGFHLVERRLDTPLEKDYDTIPGNHPTDWPARFDVSNWGMLVARVMGRRVGGAMVALETQGLDMLEGRADLALLWDIRVMPGLRGRGVGSALIGAAETWAASREARSMKVETQNVNPDACRFYSARGYTLDWIDRHAYAELPDEVQLLWYKELR